VPRTGSPARNFAVASGVASAAQVWCDKASASAIIKKHFIGDYFDDRAAALFKLATPHGGNFV